MKFLIVLTCFLAVAAANYDAKLVHESSEVRPDSFVYSWELDDHSKVEQSGKLVGDNVWTVSGSSEYVSPEGKVVALKYTADDLGYHPDPANEWIHPIPDYIIRSIEYIKTHNNDFKKHF